jgi:hypothetical protein
MVKYDMRIFEITRPRGQKQADQVLRDSGYRRLASGSFGAVYQKEGGAYVLKVFSALDKAYHAFVELAKTNQDNPHFPKIFGKVVKVTPDYHAVRMEPLEPYKNDPHTLSIYMNYRDQIHQFSPQTFTRMSFEDALENFHDQPALKQACDLIVDHLSAFTLDIKQDNIMVRGKTLVFVDPVSTAGVDTTKLPDTRKWPTDVSGEDPPRTDRKVQWTPSMERIMQELGDLD